MPVPLRYLALLLLPLSVSGACETRSVPRTSASSSDVFAISSKDSGEKEPTPIPEPAPKNTRSFWGGWGEKKTEAPIPTRYRITNAGALYSTINTTDCITWPSPAIKAVAGSNGWGGYYPKDGDIGSLVASSVHCSSKVNVLILDINGYYVPIGESGVTPEAAAPSVALAFSETYKITDAGQIYPSINTINCLTWPSEAIKAVAGTNGWGGYYPKDGEVGSLVGTSPHCNSPSVTVYILLIGGHYVPIGQGGVTLVSSP